MQLSKLENFVYGGLKNNNLSLFKIRDVCILLRISKIKAYNIIKALKRKKVIKKVGKGFFAFKDTDEFFIGLNINYPSYISFWSALNYYGFSDQMPKKIFLATTKYAKDMNNFKYVTISKNLFFGYIKIGEIVVAEKEKAIIDSLLFPKYSGGIKEIIRVVKYALDKIDNNKLINYAIKVKKKVVLRRLGFILESTGYNEKMLEGIRKRIGKGYELLDPNLGRKNKLNHRWLLDINY